MQFNPTNKTISIIAGIDFLLFGKSDVFNTDYTLIDRTRNINSALDEIIAELFKADPNFKWDDTTNTDFPIAWLNLVANRDDYVLPDSSLVFHRVRVKDPNSGKFVTLEPCERRDLSDDELDGTGTPTKYYKIDNAVILVPTPNYSAVEGVEIEFQRGANYFESTDTTESPGFASQFHRFLVVSAAKDYALANGMTDKYTLLDREKTKIIADIQAHYQTRSPDKKPHFSLKKTSVKNYLM